MVGLHDIDALHALEGLTPVTLGALEGDVTQRVHHIPALGDRDAVLHADVPISVGDEVVAGTDEFLDVLEGPGKEVTDVHGHLPTSQRRVEHRLDGIRGAGSIAGRDLGEHGVVPIRQLKVTAALRTVEWCVDDHQLAGQDAHHAPRPIVVGRPAELEQAPVVVGDAQRRMLQQHIVGAQPLVVVQFIAGGLSDAKDGTIELTTHHGVVVGHPRPDHRSIDRREWFSSLPNE